jgi:tetratricopeptide (TPR) repeat protein
MRGRIAEAAGDPKAASFWYARAMDDAPSLPFAAFDWGAMLLGHNEREGGIAKFRLANARGPHFADPLELWGETLMLQNRSDLARKKFEEAARYAPNWGRLHLKWGEALRFIGRKDDAKTQFALASSLDLTTDEEAELGKVLSRE